LIKKEAYNYNTMETMDWKNLPFGYQKTDYNVRCYWRDGNWGRLEICSSEFINMHMAATCLHYGQEAFEGLKAYRGADNQIRLFRLEENAKRMAETAEYILMQKVPVELFKEAVIKAVQLNERFVPPYGTGATLYVRPLLIGTGPEVGVKPAKEYLFLIFVTPVGAYFKEGFKPTDMVICREYDRAAPLGTGHVKVGGNYAASLLSLKKAHEGGYSSAIYLDAREKKYIDESGPANFFGIRENKYITPRSRSVLPSITNNSLMTLAKDVGLEVEQRQIELSELSTFEEAGACGTAAVISPIRSVVDPQMEKVYLFSKDGNAGPVSQKLYSRLTAIQFGDEPDKFGWITIVEPTETNAISKYKMELKEIMHSVAANVKNYANKRAKNKAK
jgi:branched-chain amino acid aminotransferase